MTEKAIPVLKVISKYIAHQEGQDFTAERLTEIDKEFTEGFKFLKNYPKSATFFGSTRSKEGERYYEKARELANRLVKEQQYSIISGGGPGIMEAADRGAFEAQGDSIGLLIDLPDGQPTNSYIKKSLSFYYLFVRKFCLAYGAEVFIFFPGGYGTLDEFFEIVTLLQTKKMHGTKVICFGSEYWNQFKTLIESELLEHGMIDPADVDLFTITDSIDEIMEVTKDIQVTKELPFDLHHK